MCVFFSLSFLIYWLKLECCLCLSGLWWGGIQRKSESWSSVHVVIDETEQWDEGRKAKSVQWSLHLSLLQHFIVAACDSLKLCLTFQWTKSTASAAVESPCGWFFSASWLPWEKWTASFLSSYFNLYSWQIFCFNNFFVLFRWQRRNGYSGLQKSTCENAWNMFFIKYLIYIYIYIYDICMHVSFNVLGKAFKHSE